MKLVLRTTWCLLVAALVLSSWLFVRYDPSGLDQWFLLPFVTSVAVGLYLTVRRMSSPMGWVFLTLGTFGFMAGTFVQPAESAWAAGVVPSDWALSGAALASAAWIVGLSQGLVFALMLFPDGLQSRRWQPVLWLAISSTTFAALVSMWQPTVGPDDGPMHRNPLSPSWLPNLPWTVPVALGLLMTCMVLAAVGMVLRFRRARGVERQQLRWFAFAAVLIPLAMALEPLGEFFLPIAIAFLPIACAIAVTRHGLYGIDRVISRTLSYAVVSLVVVGTYALVVTSVSRLVPDSGALPVAGATLAAAGVCLPVLRRVRGWVDRRFDRARFDAQQQVEAFAARMGTVVDADGVAADLASTVQQTLAPGASGVWLR